MVPPRADEITPPPPPTRAPAPLPVTTLRWQQQAEYATTALAWLYDHDFLGSRATGAVIGLVADDTTLRLLGAVGDLPPVPRRAPVALPLDGDAPLCRAARLGVCTCMPTPEAMRRRAPWLAAFAPAARSAITVPIRADGRALGSLGVTYERELFRDGRELLARTTDLGDSLGTALRTSVTPAPPWEWIDWERRPA